MYRRSVQDPRQPPGHGVLSIGGQPVEPRLGRTKILSKVVVHRDG
jgi:hypothetical protein